MTSVSSAKPLSASAARMRPIWIVEERTQPVVGGQAGPQTLRIEVVVVVPGLAIVGDHRMVRTVGLVVEPRPRQVGAGVQVVELVGRDQRVVGRYHRGEQRPRLARRPFLALAQPAHRGIGHIRVVARVRRPPAPRFFGQLAGHFAHPLVPAQQPVRVSDAVDDVDGMVHLAHPVVVAGPAVVQLADRHHVVPGVTHPVMP